MWTAPRRATPSHDHRTLAERVHHHPRGVPSGVMDASLIPDETRALLGELMDEPVTAVIAARDAQRYAYAVDDLNPIYFDEAAARAAGYRTLVAPPTFLDHVTVEGGEVADMRADGIFAGAEQRGPQLGRVMFGGQEWDW